jgi:putative hydrolase of the HAD superfamily
MPPSCIVFDLDDTLYLERDYVRSGFRAVAAWAESALGLADFFDRAWCQFENGVRGTIFQNVLAEYGHKPEPDLIAQMVGIYRGHSPEIDLLPDALHCISNLAGRIALGIITDGPATCQNLKCTNLGLRDFFELIVCTGEWGPDFYKPHPRAFEFVQRQFGNRNGSFVYVADNPLKDFHAPIALGWDTVRVRRPEGLHFEKEAPSNLAPQIEVPNLWDFPDLIENFSDVGDLSRRDKSGSSVSRSAGTKQ